MADSHVHKNQASFWYLIWILGLFQTLSIIIRSLVYLFPNDLDVRLNAWVFPGRDSSPSSYWVTHHAIPVGCHSHNDYTGPVPLYSAIKAGCVSVEADIWFSEDDLLVGHNRFTLHPAQLQSDGRNIVGVFSNNPSKTLVLIDFKTGGHITLTCLLEQLAPLRERGYITRFNGTAVVQGPVTVVVNFNSSSLYNSTNSYYASANFQQTIGKLSRNSFSQQQLADMRHQIALAHERGLKVRYWGTPTWPRGLRNHVWHVLAREQVDLVNVDDLIGGTTRDWRKQRSWFL
ncbi:hypothetical protein BJX64DRAFT_280846 [Aspergillus heterothallicus]